MRIRCASGQYIDQEFGFPETDAAAVVGEFVSIGYRDSEMCWARFWRKRFVIRYHVHRRVRIRFESKDCVSLDLTVSKMIAEMQSVHGLVVGPIPLHSRSEKYVCMQSGLRREVRINTHKRYIEIVNANSDVIMQLGKVEVPHEMTFRITESARVVQHVSV